MTTSTDQRAAKAQVAREVLQYEFESKQREFVKQLRAAANTLVEAADRLEKLDIEQEMERGSFAGLPVNSLGILQMQGTRLDTGVGELDGMLKAIARIRSVEKSDWSKTP